MTRRKLDGYNTDPRVADALVKVLPDLSGKTVLEPHAGGGAFCRALIKHHLGVNLTALDIDPGVKALHEGPWTKAQGDFLEWSGRADWIIGNPPYSEAAAHIRQGLQVATEGLAFLLRVSILGSVKRRELWAAFPPAEVRVLTPRPSFTGGGNDTSEYAWVVWSGDGNGTSKLSWIHWR